jgi:hypothetical protein
MTSHDLESDSEKTRVQTPDQKIQLEEGDKPVDFPEGGLKAWSVILGV